MSEPRRASRRTCWEPVRTRSQDNSGSSLQDFVGIQTSPQKRLARTKPRRGEVWTERGTHDSITLLLTFTDEHSNEKLQSPALTDDPPSSALQLARPSAASEGARLTTRFSLHIEVGKLLVGLLILQAETPLQREQRTTRRYHDAAGRRRTG